MGCWRINQEVVDLTPVIVYPLPYSHLWLQLLSSALARPHCDWIAMKEINVRLYSFLDGESKQHSCLC